VIEWWVIAAASAVPAAFALYRDVRFLRERHDQLLEALHAVRDRRYLKSDEKHAVVRGTGVEERLERLKRTLESLREIAWQQRLPSSSYRAPASPEADKRIALFEEDLAKAEEQLFHAQDFLTLALRRIAEMERK